MKRYKLIKDLPTFDAGDTFHVNGNGNLVHDESGVVAYAKRTLTQFPNILEDWFEEFEGDESWMPREGEIYCYLRSDGTPSKDFFVTGMDRDRQKLGNCFKTEEDVKKAVEWLKAFKVLRDDTKGYKPDGWQENYYVYLDHDDGLTWLDDGSEISSPIMFGTPEDAAISIQKHRKEWLTFFGVEEDNE